MKLIAQNIGIRNWLEVPAKNITMQGSKGEVEIKPPLSDMGYKPIRLLLLSYRWREGQVKLSVENYMYGMSCGPLSEYVPQVYGDCVCCHRYMYTCMHVHSLT